MKPHSLVISVIGACLLWVGWFGFNAGSALAASALATSAFVATHFAAAAAALGWMLAEWIRNGKPSVLGAISGAVAGLVAITPASGFVKPFPALLIGFLAGVVCFLMVTAVKSKFGYDDSSGRLRRARRGRNAGRAADRRVRHQRGQRRLEGRHGKVLPLGWWTATPARCSIRPSRCLISWGLAIVGTLIILKICDVVIGVRVVQRGRAGGPGPQHAWRRRI